MTNELSLMQHQGERGVRREISGSHLGGDSSQNGGIKIGKSGSETTAENLTTSFCRKGEEDGCGHGFSEDTACAPSSRSHQAPAHSVPGIRRLG